MLKPQSEAVKAENTKSKNENIKYLGDMENMKKFQLKRVCRMPRNNSKYMLWQRNIQKKNVCSTEIIDYQIKMVTETFTLKY